MKTFLTWYKSLLRVSGPMYSSRYSCNWTSCENHKNGISTLNKMVAWTNIKKWLIISSPHHHHLGILSWQGILWVLLLYLFVHIVTHYLPGFWAWCMSEYQYKPGLCIILKKICVKQLLLDKRMITFEVGSPLIGRSKPR